MKERLCTLLLTVSLGVALSADALGQKLELGVYGGGSFWSKPSFTTTVHADTRPALPRNNRLPGPQSALVLRPSGYPSAAQESQQQIQRRPQGLQVGAV